MDDARTLGLLCLTWLARAAVQSTLLIVLVLLLRQLLRPFVSSTWLHLLWLLVLVRLALPNSFETKLSLYNWLPVDRVSFASPGTVSLPVQVTKSAAAVISATTTMRPINAILSLETNGAANESTSQSEWLSRSLPWLGAFWLLGVIVLTARVIVEAVRLQRSIVPRRLVTDSSVLELLEDCKQFMQVRVPVVLVSTDIVPTPILYGFVRPRLLLPSRVLREFSPEELRLIFLHELAHIRRHDIALAWLATVLQVLHWFNPLVWLAFARMRSDRELACDSFVLARTNPSEHKLYGRTMLRLLEGESHQHCFPAMAGILENPSELAQRIRSIVRFKNLPLSPAFSLAAVLLLGVALLTDGRAYSRSALPPLLNARLSIKSAEALTENRSVWLRSVARSDVSQLLNAGTVLLTAKTNSSDVSDGNVTTVAMLDGLGSDHWRRGAVDDTVLQRTAHSALWTGRELLIWGGGVQDHFLRRGALYDPAADKWRSMNTNAYMAGRWHHAAVWTGTEMIVWGGRASFFTRTNRGDGSIYTLATDSWRRIATNGAPPARSQMAAIWTGKEMIVWGGRGEDQVSFNDGGRYDPNRDQWKPLPVAPLSARYDVTTVWTGREMIIWGGCRRDGTNSFSFSDGAAYDPFEDRWKPLPTEGAPSARTKHTAVWTGSKMLVWGGVHYPTGAFLDDGAAFDPATRHWEPLPAVTLSPRFGHVAVFTGSDMVVWGGVATNNECLNTGARYNVATRHWYPLSNQNPPAPRFMMRPDAGVWTGRELLIFGGYDLHSEFNTVHAWSPPPVLFLVQRNR